jgi:hypothetical protein
MPCTHRPGPYHANLADAHISPPRISPEQSDSSLLSPTLDANPRHGKLSLKSRNQGK